MTASDAAAKQKIPLVSFLVQNNLAQASQVASAASVEFGIPLLDVRSLLRAPAPDLSDMGDEVLSPN